MAVLKIPLEDAKRTSPVSLRSGQVAASLDVDCENKRVYWTDTSGRLLREANFDGSDERIFARIARGGFPEGVAIDASAGNVFWTDPGKRTVEVASMATGRGVVLHEEMIGNPRGIAVIPSVG